MASAFALAIFSGIGFLFGIQKSLRAFLNPLFTSRVVTENGICSAAFCESAARRGNLRQALNRLNSLSQNLTVLPAPSEREPLAWRYSFRLKRKACGRACSPLGELSRND